MEVIGGSFKEVWLPGTFRRSLREGGHQGDVLALWSHDPSQVLGRRSAGTLALEDRTEGLAVAVDLPDTQLGRDARALALRGDVAGMSFSFLVPQGGDRWKREGGMDLRVVHRAELIEVSPVASQRSGPPHSASGGPLPPPSSSWPSATPFGRSRSAGGSGDDDDSRRRHLPRTVGVRRRCFQAALRVS